MTHPSLTDIVAAVSEEYHIPTDVIMNHDRRTLQVTHARHVAQYLASILTFLSKGQIANCFQQRDHSAVIYATNKISKLVLTDEAVRDRIRRVKTALTK